MRPRATRFLWAGCWLALSACGGSITTGASLASSGTVLERSEGYAERPSWADAEHPFSQSGETIRIVGYVAIDAGQRVETGYRAADSYARAELIRFLSVRVVAVLEDELKSGQPGALSERIEETARSWTDELIIAQRYHEKRRHDSGEKIHIWSRLDIDRGAAVELLERATADASDLRDKKAQLAQALSARWSELAEVGDASAGTPLAPAGVLTPEWAKAGDREDDEGFRFVCFGLAEDEATARALARARCSEKLCRLFGVQITARTTVTEDLEGITAESEVSEQCAEIRVKDRETVYQADECGPRGCVQWLMQSYPRSAYEEERKRLDQPTVIRQEVVIQEGDKKYSDPAACETSLRAYGAVEGRSAAAFEARAKHLSSALQVCQSIDTRDSGLFVSMNLLLTAPLPSFTNDYSDPYDRNLTVRDTFTYASAEWRSQLETSRFLTDRIQAVRKLVTDAILPMRILDAGNAGADSAALDALMRDVMKQPFGDRPASAHHRANVHAIAITLPGKRVPPHAGYRDFLLGQVERGKVRCTRSFDTYGRDVIDYFGADGTFDDREWAATIALLRTAEDRSISSCISSAFRRQEHRGKRRERIDQVAGLIASGEFKPGDPKRILASLLSALPDEEAPEILLRWYDKTPGSESAESMVDNVMLGAFMRRPKDMDEATYCAGLPNAVRPFFERIPSASASKTSLCSCLREKALTAASRRAIAELLVTYATQACASIEPGDWPGEYYELERPQYRSLRGARVLPHGDAELSKGLEACHKEHVALDHASTATNGTATVHAKKLTRVKVEAVIYGKLNSFTRKSGRGLPQAREIRAMNEALSGCIARVLEGYTIPYESAKPGRVWFQLWGTNIGSNGYEN